MHNHTEIYNDLRSANKRIQELTKRVAELENKIDKAIEILDTEEIELEV